MSNKLLNCKPVKMWLNNKIFPIHNLTKSKSSAKKRKVQLILDEDHLQLLDIKKREDGKFTTDIIMPKLYYTKLKNFQQFTLEEVAEQTQSEISLIPEQLKSANDEVITLYNDNQDNLAEAVTLIHSAIGEIRQRSAALQFTCIPCSTPEIQERFEQLKNDILSMEKEIEGLHESIFICPKKLHLTIDVYTLLDEREQLEAVKALQEYQKVLEDSFMSTGPWKLDIANLDCMNNNLKKVDVIYANVRLLNETSEHNLQKIVNELAEFFYHRGLAKRYQENIKIHMTIINTKYRKQVGSPKWKRRRQSIDATKIMEKFKNYNFGHCEFNSVHLSHICLKGEDGFYKPLAVINLNNKLSES